MNYSDLRKAGICARCGGERAQSAVLKFQQSDGLIFGLYVVAEDSKRPDDGLYTTGKPLEQVYCVHSLIHERAAAVHVPCALPASMSALVIALPSVPGEDAVHAYQFAKTTSINGIFNSFVH